ncbi:FABP family protein [Mucilaginibacter ginsenosidivorans]|uniref:FABP family protein n=1 Tax=Mucilaginibacter ginsenosidivorans TaxID=398053 RepID=A0A5B8UWH8_9SPHI|nr:FABP family protein [Mucilaginibacter ginsenosidivorans]QEC63414.1 FABP family protein [Mucilaginibacter ginsenosidivorans]
MTEEFQILRNLLRGKWEGEGFAQYPTIDNTKYAEKLVFRPDEFKDAIYFDQKTFYKNDTEKNGQTVFWDTGFIVLKEGRVLLVSSQISGRQETYELVRNQPGTFIFESLHIENDTKQTLRSQRVFTITDSTLSYELNMAACGCNFQNHLSANLKRIA